MVLTIAPVLVAAVGWFFLSWLVVHTRPGDAVGEALGVAFGLLILLSVIGAVRGRNQSAGQDR